MNCFMRPRARGGIALWLKPATRKSRQRAKFSSREGLDRPGVVGFYQAMDHPLIELINAKVKEAEAEGAFDQLSGAGKPLPQVDDPQNAYINRVMRENGAVPEFVKLSQQMALLREALRESADRTERQRLMAEIAALEPRLAIARDSWKT